MLLNPVVVLTNAISDLVYLVEAAGTASNHEYHVVGSTRPVLIQV